MTDDVVRELERVGGRGRVRGASAIYAAALDEHDRLEGDPGADGRALRRRGALVLRAAMVLLVLGLAAAIALSRQGSAARPFDPADLLPSRLFDPRRQQVDEWLDSYDQAEIEHLLVTKDEGYGEVTDELLIGTLEFRRTCRFLQRAIDAAAAAPTGEGRAVTVASIMQPQTDRFRERSGSEGNMDEGWEELTARLQAGEPMTVEAFVTNNCEDSFGPWIDE